MPIDAPYEPSPWEPVATQVEQYESSGGTEGTELQGAPCIILSTLGAKSGKQRKTPLMRVEHDGHYAVIASLGGAPQNPVWYHNILARPDVVTLQDGPTVKDYDAHEATGDEKTEWWARATAVWPAYDEYQAKTDRQIPLFVLTPRA
ncbi:MAG TPA: nitroreductase family deazaflavin-dependent oxidoreductase [Iamia sp.]|nr:nitroreductase family deazaflavin-dependent oxidoreductase [Iamia sp.]